MGSRMGDLYKSYLWQMALDRDLLGGETLLNSHKPNMNKGGAKTTKIYNKEWV